jgi:ABC-type antimicrobial peptide transport system permease subunit
LPAIVLIIGLVGGLAALGPARRGLRIEPAEALRAE